VAIGREYRIYEVGNSNIYSSPNSQEWRIGLL
jgi:hypothetical protein